MEIRYTLQYATEVRGTPVKGTMTVMAATDAAAEVKARAAIRARFREYGLKIKLKFLDRKELI